MKQMPSTALASEQNNICIAIIAVITHQEIIKWGENEHMSKPSGHAAIDGSIKGSLEPASILIATLGKHKTLCCANPEVFTR
jgi:hypothetical protein